MHPALASSFLTILLILPPGVIAAPMDGTSPPEVIARLVANASENPPGPVEGDVTSQTLTTANAMLKFMQSDGGGSVRQSIATEYDQFAIEGLLAPLYSDGSAALFYGKVKLTPDAVADHKDDGSSAAFGAGGAFCVWVGPRVRDDGHIVATFCLLKQNGQWKVHGVYLSNDVLAGDDKAFIVRQLAALAKKS